MPNRAPPPIARVAPLPVAKPDPEEVEFVHVLERDLRRDLERSTLRVRLWISFAALEVVVLLAGFFWPR